MMAKQLPRAVKDADIRYSTWATESKIIASVLLLQTTIYIYGPCAKINKWQKHAINTTCETETHHNECIYIFSTTWKHLKDVNSFLSLSVWISDFNSIMGEANYCGTMYSSAILRVAGKSSL